MKAVSQASILKVLTCSVLAVETTCAQSVLQMEGEEPDRYVGASVSSAPGLDIANPLSAQPP